jgi:hypothetical protein
MKTILAVLFTSIVLSVSIAEAAEVKKVCVDKVTNDGKKVLDKEGKPVQECKEIKVHQKLEGTKVPEKK